jgi:hypothetical protein
VQLDVPRDSGKETVSIDEEEINSKGNVVVKLSDVSRDWNGTEAFDVAGLALH